MRGAAQEQYLSSKDSGSWRWSIGAMYNHVKTGFVIRWRDSDKLVDLFNTYMFDQSNSYALFGQLTRMFLDDRLEVTAGLRSFHDDLSYFADLGVLTPPGADNISNEKSFRATTPTFIVNWRPARNLTFYASYAQGFRSGQTQEGFTLSQIPDAPTVRPDKLTSYEIGSKGVVLDGALSWETAAYYQNWKDRQENRLVHTPIGIDTNMLINAESARGSGFEASLTAHPNRSLGFGVTFAWNGLENSEDVLTPDGTQIVVAKDTAVAGVPVRTAGAFADYRVALSAGFEGQFSVDYHWEDGYARTQLAGPVAPLYFRNGDMRDLRASFTLSAPKNWDFTLFANNILNDQVGNYLPIAPTIFDSTPTVRPRMIGIQVVYRPQIE